VLVTSLHQHEAPLADVEGQRILEEYQISTGKICSPAYHEDCIQKTSTAVRTAMHQVRTVTHLGFGEGKVDRVSSNRRAELPNGTITFQRSSTTTNADVRNAPEGLIDPHLKTLTFWNHDQAIAALSSRTDTLSPWKSYRRLHGPGTLASSAANSKYVSDVCRRLQR
jgi:hypothetical protein